MRKRFQSISSPFSTQLYSSSARTLLVLTILLAYTGLLQHIHAFLFAQATPSSLIGINNRGELVEGRGEVQIEATAIHKGVHDARKDAVCVFHLHAPYTTALGINSYVF